jgi:hypothetical protein
MIFDLDDLAIGGGLSEAQSRAVINPRMPGHDAVSFTRL